MSLTVKDTGGGDFKIPDPGAHVAVCDLVVDLGLQPNSYNPAKPKQKVYLRWQLPNERLEFEKDGKHHNLPMTVGSMFTASLSKKAVLREFLEAWRGKPFTDKELAGFDLFTILGAPCQVNIIHNESNGKTYANVTGVMPLPKGMDKPKVEGKTVKYSPETPDQYEEVPEWLRKKIESAVTEESHDTVAQTRRNGLEDEDQGKDLPF